MRLTKLALQALPFLLLGCVSVNLNQTPECFDHGTRVSVPVMPNTCATGLTLCRTTFYSCAGETLTSTDECLDVPCPGLESDYGTGGAGGASVASASSVGGAGGTGGAGCASASSAGGGHVVMQAAPYCP